MARKTTSDRVSRIAARVMRKCSKLGAIRNIYDDGETIVTMADILALAGSAMGQDGTKGKRKRARK